MSVCMGVRIGVLHFGVINANMPFCGFTGILHKDISFALLCLYVCLPGIELPCSFVYICFDHISNCWVMGCRVEGPLPS